MTPAVMNSGPMEYYKSLWRAWGDVCAQEEHRRVRELAIDEAVRRVFLRDGFGQRLLHEAALIDPLADGSNTNREIYYALIRVGDEFRRIMDGACTA